MKKITYLALHLGYGGVEKAIANQANILCHDFDVEIISAYKLTDVPPFTIDPRVKIRYLITDMSPNKNEFLAAIRAKNLKNILREARISLSILMRRVSLMRRAVRNLDSDIVVSSRYLYNRLLRFCRPGTVTIAQEHRHHDGDMKYVRRLCRSVKHADYFMPVSQKLTDFYAAQLRDFPVKCVYIPHNLDSWPSDPAALTNHTIVSVGRFSPEKGYLDLIDIFALFHKTHPDWKLHLLGDGDEMSQVREKISFYALSENVVLHGFQPKEIVNRVLSESAVYAMASVSESFGIVLIEAQSHGLPCVAFDSAQGATEIIHHNQDGYLIPGRNKDAFAAKLGCLADSLSLRRQLGANGRESSMQYAEENIANKLKHFMHTILS